MQKNALLLVLVMIFFDWLDFTLYLYLAKSIFAVNFFPHSSLSLTLTFAIFAGSYFTRPLGGWLFGKRADRQGRRAPMIASAGLMGIATLGMCLLPTYEQAGLWASWGLLFCRLAQGLAAGGEVNTSAIFLIEHYRHAPFTAGSLVAISGVLGMCTGGAIAALLHTFAQPNSWRYVFAVAGILSLLICLWRKQLVEPVEFLVNQKKPVLPWRYYWRGLLNIAVAAAYVSVTVYLCNVFWVSFAIDKQLMSKSACAWAGSLAQLGAALTALFIARFAKAHQVYTLLQCSMLIAAVSAPLLFYCTAKHIFAGVLLGLGGYVLADGLICTALYYFLYLQLPAQYRCRGVATIGALAASLGAICLPVAEQVTAHGIEWFPGMAVMLIAITGLMVCREFPAPSLHVVDPELKLPI